MAAADRPRKVLRLGVIQAGKMVEERLLPARTPVTIGSGARNTVVVPLSDLPEALTVFSCSGERYSLIFGAGVEGRIQGPEGSADLGALVSQGLARREGGAYVVPLEDDQRGKLVLGEITLLWQFVVPPPELPRPVLPREARGRRFESLDRLFVSVLALSFACHTGVYVTLSRTAAPKEVTLEEIPDRYARVLLPERLAKRPPPEERKPERRKPAEETEEKKVEAEQRPDAAEKVAERKAARAAAVAKAVQSKGILKVLGALGPGATRGAVADVFGSGAGLGDVATALSGAGGVAMAPDPEGAAGRKGGGPGGAASIGELATTGGGKIAYGAKSEVHVSGAVAAEEAEVDSAEVDAQKLAAFVKARMGLIKACYENALKRNPKLHGRISIRFTVLETGGLSDVTAAQDAVGSREVASCIVSTMRTWRTPFRPSGPVTVEYPFVFQPVG